MLLMSRMEDNRLNFEKPLLSVRHFSLGATLKNDSKRNIDKSLQSAPRPPPYEAELKSGPVRNPGTVPFSWEQNPGRPKDEIEHKSSVVDDRPPTGPKLPPGRSTKVNQENLDRSVRKNNAGCIRSFDDESKQAESSKDEKEDAGSTRSGDEEDEEYVDARGALSRTESFFINCSISGLSGLEDSDAREFECSSIDSQTRDLMMGRFLPAAMAMTSESPQHPHWKLPVVSQQPKKLVGDLKQARLRYGTNFVPDYSRYYENGDGGSDADFKEPENFPSGILPCLVSPLRGMSVRTLAPESPFRKPRPLLSSSGSPSEADAKRPSVRPETLNLQACNKELKNNSKIHLSNNGTSGVSAYRQLEVGDVPADGYGISVDCNGSVEYNSACRNSEEATHPNGNGSELNKVVRRSFEELLAEENRSNELDAGSPVAERTVYVVSEHKVEPQTSTSHDSDIQDQLEGKKHQAVMEKSQKTDQNLTFVKDEQERLPVKSSTYEGTRHLQTGMSRLLFHENDRFKGSRTSLQEFMHPSAPPGPEKFENCSELPLPPPLPKTPSDSWLGRTLPSMSGKKSSVHPYLMSGASPKHQASKPKSSNPKWEKIVKMTKVQEKPFLYSQEWLTPIPEA